MQSVTRPWHFKPIGILLLAALLLPACARAADPALSPVSSPEPTSVAGMIALTPTATAAPEAGQPALAPTPRGPDLVATDPASVELASGRLQLVEFFRFT